MLAKPAAGYMHKPGTEYICGDCIFYFDEEKKCQLLAGGDNVLVFDGCNNFCPGPAGSLSDSRNPLYALTPQEVGLTHSEYGFSCKRCVHYGTEDWSCAVVDKESEGDDQGMIHPDACCNSWERDPSRGMLPTEVVRSLINITETRPNLL